MPYHPNQRNTFEWMPYLPHSGLPRAPEDAASANGNQQAGGGGGSGYDRNHPLRHLHARLAKLVPTLPRDADGCIDSAAFRAALAEMGIDTDHLELEGYVELLARCDMSPNGFPSFDEFVRCFRIEMPHQGRGVATLLSAEGSQSAGLWSARRARDAEELARMYSRRSADFAREYNLGNLSAEELAKIYARGARLHASQLQTFPRKGMNTAELPLTAEVLARVPGGEAAMPGLKSRPDGYRLDASGSYMGVLPGMARDASEWPPAEYKEVLAEAEDGTWGWVVKDSRPATADGLAGLGGAGLGGAGLGGAGLGGAPSNGLGGGGGPNGDEHDWLKTGGSLSGRGLGPGQFGNTGRAASRAAGPNAGGEKLLNPMTGGRPSSTSGKESDRRSFHVAKGSGVVPSPRKAGPACHWRKFV